jgi:hypothetical protein
MMFRLLNKRTASAICAGLLVLLAAVTPVAAQDQTAAAAPGTSRETAGPNFPEAVQLNPGETQWYKFRYTFDENLDNETQTAAVALKMDTIGCATFDVTTSGRLNFPFDADGDLVGPVGQGTPFSTGGDDPQEIDPSQLDWVGSSPASETYFVIVKHHGDSPCMYKLSITGSPVSF